MSEYQSLLDKLNSSDAAVRLSAITDAAIIGSPEIVRMLGKLVRQAEIGEAPRQAAVEALGQNPHADAISELSRMAISDDPTERELTAIGLGQRNNPETIRLLIELLSDKVNTVRNLAERSLLALPEGVREWGIESLLVLLKHPIPLTRSPAARLLGLAKEPRALEPLLQLAKFDKQWLVRMWACKGLGDLGFVQALEVLAERLKSDEKNRVRAAAAEALGKLPHPQVEQILTECQHDEDGGVQKHIEESLAKLKRAHLGHDQPEEHHEPHFDEDSTE